jgi:hypothetical protein
MRALSSHILIPGGINPFFGGVYFYLLSVRRSVDRQLMDKLSQSLQESYCKIVTFASYYPIDRVHCI